MRNLRWWLLLVALALPVLALESGLAVGSSTPAYHPRHVAGPDKGTDVCPV